jgi:hypothetical protein
MLHLAINPRLRVDGSHGDLEPPTIKMRDLALVMDRLLEDGIVDRPPPVRRAVDPLRRGDLPEDPG